MPTLAQIRGGIVAVMGTVAGIGVVNDYERFVKDRAGLLSLYTSAGQLRGWFVQRMGAAERAPAVGRYVIVNRWQIRGFMALDDSAGSEKTFDDLVEAVRAAFRADDTLGGLVDTLIVGDEAGAQLTESGPVMFAGVLAHGARLALNTRHYE